MNDSGNAVRGRNKIIALVIVLSLGAYVGSLPGAWYNGRFSTLVPPAIVIGFGVLLLRGWRWARALMELLLGIVAVRWALAALAEREVSSRYALGTGAVAVVVGACAVILYASADISRFFAARRGP